MSYYRLGFVEKAMELDREIEDIREKAKAQRAREGRSLPSCMLIPLLLCLTLKKLYIIYLHIVKCIK